MVDTPRSPAVPNKRNLAPRVPFVLLLVLGLSFLIGSYRLSLGSITDPGPGLWPFLVSLALLACSCTGLFTADGSDMEAFGRSLIRPVLGLGALCLFVLLFWVAGIILAGTVVLVFWFRYLAREPWTIVLPLAVGASVGAYLLFVVALGAVFPDDLIAGLWGGR